MNCALSCARLPADTETLKRVCGHDEISRRRQGFPPPSRVEEGEGGRLGCRNDSDLCPPSTQTLLCTHTHTHRKEASKVAFQSSSQPNSTSKGQEGGARDGASVQTWLSAAPASSRRYFYPESCVIRQKPSFGRLQKTHSRLIFPTFALLQKKTIFKCGGSLRVLLLHRGS